MIHTSPETLIDLMHKIQYNWFEFCEHVPENCNLDQFYTDVTKTFSPEQVKLITQSRSAFVASESDLLDQSKLARSINGEVVTDSDSESCLSDDQTDFTTENL